MPDLTLTTLPEMRVVAVPHRGAYHQIGPAFEALGDLLRAANAFGHTGEMLGIYYDDPFTVPEAELRSHAGAIWTGGDPIPDGLEEVHLEGGRYAIHTHVGSYEGLGAAWVSVTPEDFAATGAAPREGPTLEIYRNSPMDTPEAELRTDLCLPAG